MASNCLQTLQTVCAGPPAIKLYLLWWGKCASQTAVSDLSFIIGKLLLTVGKHTDEPVYPLHSIDNFQSVHLSNRLRMIYT